LPVDEQTTVGPAAAPHEEVGAAPFEAAQRVGRLHFHCDVPAERGAELVVGVLRRVQKHGIDGASRLLDAGDAQIEIHGNKVLRMSRTRFPNISYSGGRQTGERDPQTRSIFGK
jgi:hypothetical protein